MVLRPTQQCFTAKSLTGFEVQFRLVKQIEAIGLNQCVYGRHQLQSLARRLTVSSRYKDNEARMNGRLTIYF